MNVARIKTALRKPWVQRGLTGLLLLIVVVLLVRQSRNIEWSEVMRSLRSYERSTLALALALSAASYAVYSCFDVLARRYIRRRLPTLRVMGIAFISYAFNQSLGSLLGTIAFRLRLYARLGLRAGEISKIIALSVLTNWLGYFVLAGALFSFGAVALPETWDVGKNALRFAGVLLLCIAAAYMATAAVRGGQVVEFRKHRFKVPDLTIAGTQLGLSVAHWPLASACLYVLLGGQVEYFTVLGTMFLSAVAVVMTHVPAGVGILEAVFIAALRHRMPVSEIVAALLAFRAVHFLVPLVAAAALYLRAELQGREATPMSPASSRR